MKKFRIMFVLLITLFVIPSVVNASSIRTTQLDLTSMDLTSNQENLSEGWKWDASTNTLILTDINFNVTGDHGIVLPSDKNLTITLVGINNIKSDRTAIVRKSSSNNTGIITINGDGNLEVVATGTNPTIDLPNLVITSGKIKAINGSITALGQISIVDGEVIVDTTNALPNSNNDGIYGNGNVSISGGIINLTVTGAGIFVPGIGSEQPLVGVNITGGKINISSPIAAIYAGYKYLSFDIQKNVIIDGSSIDFKDSDLGIYSANGTITISKKTSITAKAGAKIYGFNPENDVRELNIDSADYTDVDAQLANIPSDLAKYTDDSVAELESVKSAIIRDKNFLEQSIVDEYATKLKAAIKKLKVKNFSVATTINKNGSINLSGTNNVEYGNSRELTVITDTGYVVKSIKVNGVDKTSDLVNGKLTLLKITSNLEITVETEPEKYEFISGKDAIYDGKELVFKLNGLYSLFDKLYINETEISEDNYTVVEGSTIITLSNEYLKTLSAGTYRLKVTYINGSNDETKFTINSISVNDSDIENPSTGDNILVYACLCLISIIGLTGTSLCIKKSLNRRSI